MFLFWHSFCSWNVNVCYLWTNIQTHMAFHIPNGFLAKFRIQNYLFSHWFHLYYNFKLVLWYRAIKKHIIYKNIHCKFITTPLTVSLIFPPKVNQDIRGHPKMTSRKFENFSDPPPPSFALKWRIYWGLRTLSHKTDDPP